MPVPGLRVLRVDLDGLEAIAESRAVGGEARIGHGAVAEEPQADEREILGLEASPGAGDLLVRGVDGAPPNGADRERQ